MTARAFIPWPDQRLRTAVPEVADITGDIHALWADLADSMDAMPAGVGLAGPQIGVMMQLAVVDASPDKSRRIFLANPSILSADSEMVLMDEGSPNLPGVSAKIKRPKAVSVRYVNDQGTVERRDFVGLEARSVQHQIDHLNGRMYFDNLSKVKRDMLLRKARKAQGT